MSTNYYFQKRDRCHSCGRAFKREHIGKSVHGRAFMLHVYPEKGIYDLGDWLKYMPRMARAGNHIVDEYGNYLSVGDLLRVIVDRPENAPHSMTSDPCLYAYGDGPWVCIVGDFS